MESDSPLRAKLRPLLDGLVLSDPHYANLRAQLFRNLVGISPAEAQEHCLMMLIEWPAVILQIGKPKDRMRSLLRIEPFVLIPICLDGLLASWNDEAKTEAEGECMSFICDLISFLLGRPRARFADVQEYLVALHLSTWALRSQHAEGPIMQAATNDPKWTEFIAARSTWFPQTTDICDLSTFVESAKSRFPELCAP